MNLLDWCLRDANKSTVKAFVKQLTGQLHSVILSSVKKSFSYNKEKMWKQYFVLRTFKGFIKQWTYFIANIGTPIHPVLYQHLTDGIFKALIKSHFQIQYLQPEITALLTSNKKNVI